MSRLHGSQVNIQWSINVNQEYLEEEILKLAPDWIGGRIKFYSPLKEYNYKEYAGNSFIKGHFDNGQSFWKELGATCPDDIRDGSFWPVKGANWDAIAVLTKPDGKKVLLLFEAKAHLGELIHRKNADEWCENSKEIIQSSLEKTIGRYSEKDFESWLQAYQFSNRIAYAKHLNDCEIETCIIYILYNNDCSFSDKAISSNEKRNWQSKLKKLYGIVGISEDSINFYHVIELESPTKEQLLDAGINIEEAAYKY